MPGIGVNVAIIANNRVLLTKRRDFEVWCLPGGEVDAGETLAQAALREVREETGLEVKLDRLVGVYSRPGWLNGGLHVVVFCGQVSGGNLTLQENEVLEAAYFGPGELPEALLFGTRRRALDALEGVGGGLAWLQDAHWDFEPGTTRQDLYRNMAASGLPPQEYYLQNVGKPMPDGERLEVGTSGSNLER